MSKKVTQLMVGAAFGLLGLSPGVIVAQQAPSSAPTCDALVAAVRLPQIDTTERRRAVAFCRQLLPALSGVNLLSAASCASAATSFEAVGVCAQQALASGPEQVTPDLLCTAVAVGATSRSVAERHALFDGCRARVRQAVARTSSVELLRCLREASDARACWTSIPPSRPRASAEAMTESGRGCRFDAPDVAAGQQQVVLYSCGSGDATWPCYPRFEVDIIGENAGREHVFFCGERTQTGVGAVAVTDSNYSVLAGYAFDQIGRTTISSVQALARPTVQLRIDDDDGHGTLRTLILGTTPASPLAALWEGFLEEYMGTGMGFERSELVVLGSGTLYTRVVEAAEADLVGRRAYFRWSDAQASFLGPIHCADPRDLEALGVHPERIDSMEEWLTFASDYAAMPLARLLGAPRVRRGPSYAAYPIAWTEGSDGCPAVVVRAVGYSQAPNTDAPDTSYVIYGVVGTDLRTGRPHVVERRIAATDSRVVAAIARGHAIQEASGQ